MTTWKSGCAAALCFGVALALLGAAVMEAFVWCVQRIIDGGSGPTLPVYTSSFLAIGGTALAFGFIWLGLEFVDRSREGR